MQREGLQPNPIEEARRSAVPARPELSGLRLAACPKAMPTLTRNPRNKVRPVGEGSSAHSLRLSTSAGQSVRKRAVWTVLPNAIAVSKVRNTRVNLPGSPSLHSYLCSVDTPTPYWHASRYMRHIRAARAKPPVPRAGATTANDMSQRHIVLARLGQTVIHTLSALAGPSGSLCIQADRTLVRHRTASPGSEGRQKHTQPFLSPWGSIGIRLQ